MTRPTLKKGSKGGSVRHLQEALASAGFDPGVPDGHFGIKTDQAVRAFQADRGLTDDGIVGARTWVALEAASPTPSRPAGGGGGAGGGGDGLQSSANDEGRSEKTGKKEWEGRKKMERVTLWVNAFIPKDVPGLSKPAPSAHAGKTMLHGPISGVSDCFLTDNRDFSSKISAPSRMHSEIEIDVSGLREISQRHRCDTTTEIDCEDGDVECSRKGDTSRMRFRNLRGNPTSLVHVDLTAAANNPCFTGSPDIDYTGTFTIDPPGGTIEFNGMIDAFPAFEAYAVVDGGAPLTMFRTLPIPGKNPWNLGGSAVRAQTGRVRA